MSIKQRLESRFLEIPELTRESDSFIGLDFLQKNPNLKFMNPFVLYNPTKLIFGQGTVAKISNLIPKNARVLLVYGGGSVKKNGSYDQTISALGKRKVVEFSGIEANPEYETCLKAVDTIRKNKLDFILALGGGSVIDACKFIAAATPFKGKNPWQILTSYGSIIKEALPLGTVLTIPATGSEMNQNSVISRRATEEKLAFASDLVFPQFSILDPTFTLTLPDRQISNGVVDAFVHVMEQYCTRPSDAPVQDGFSETIMKTLVEEGPKALRKKDDMAVRSNIMLCATMALNKLICIGVPEDWSTHLVGHEITALYGLDHAQSLAIVLPKMLRYKSAAKGEKIAQLGRNVFGIAEKSKKVAIKKTIEAIVKFFKKMKIGTEFADYKIGAEAPEKVAANIAKHYKAIGENADITPEDVAKLLKI